MEVLTIDQKLANKKEYLRLLSLLNVDLTEFSKYLNSVDYFNKPATAQTFRAYEGGLCQYAVDLCYELGTLCNAYCPNVYSKEEIIKVALLRDIYRAELYESYNQNVKNESTGNWEAVKAFRTKKERQTFGDIGFSSYMIAKNFFVLNDEEIEAICHSRPTENYVSDLHDILRKYKLVTLLRMADMATSYLGD